MLTSGEHHGADPHQGEALVTTMMVMVAMVVASLTPGAMVEVRDAQPKLGGNRGQAVGENEGRGALLLKQRKW